MRHAFLFSAALFLAITGGACSAPQHTIAASQAAYSSGPQAASHGPSVLLVCNGSTVRCPVLPPSARPYYPTVQRAVNAARSGDWILIYPGVYHEKSKQWPTAGVWIQKPDLHIRGLERNRVIIDGSNGTAAHPCPAAAAQQDVTPRDGIVVWKASGVTIQNLTVCDYLAGGGDHGNEIWWNGGDGTGAIGLGAYSGSYLTATSEYAPARLNSPATGPVRDLREQLERARSHHELVCEQHGRLCLLCGRLPRGLRHHARERHGGQLGARVLRHELRRTADH
jgi:hypothetical protein